MGSKWDITDEQRAERDAEVVRLWNIDDAGHVSMTELARRYNTTVSNISRIVNRAAERYWAVRPKRPRPYL